jgi:hypothetical protein
MQSERSLVDEVRLSSFHSVTSEEFSNTFPLTPSERIKKHAGAAAARRRPTKPDREPAISELAATQFQRISGTPSIKRMDDSQFKPDSDLIHQVRMLAPAFVLQCPVSQKSNPEIVENAADLLRRATCFKNAVVQLSKFPKLRMICWVCSLGGEVIG